VNPLSLPDDLSTTPMDELRGLRRSWQIVEDCTSLMRRMAQGRMEIVQAELGRRHTGADPSTVAQLVASLPDVLEVQVPSGPTRLVHHHGNFDDPDLLAEIDAVCDAATLTDLPGLADDRLQGLLDDLRGLETSLSDRRKASFVALERLADEIGRRYLAGLAA
jgi:hypothetical protein